MKHLKTTLFIGIFALFVSTQVQAQGIEFLEGTFAEAQTKAKAEGKEIFMDFHTAWCAPCKKMAKEFFTLKTVGDVYNQKYISIKVDAEKGEGPKLAKKYGVRAYPTLVYAKPDGTEIKKVMGMKNEIQLLELAK